MEQFIINNLPIIFGAIGAVGTVFYIKGRNKEHKDNDMTSRLVKYKKQGESLNKRSKSAF